MIHTTHPPHKDHVGTVRPQVDKLKRGTTWINECYNRVVWVLYDHSNYSGNLLGPNCPRGPFSVLLYRTLYIGHALPVAAPA